MNDEAASPSTGGRLVARLVSSDDGRATYSLELSADDRAWLGHASVTVHEGTVELDGFESSTPVPTWLDKLATTTLRAAWQRRRAGADWPRRLARWRPAAGDEQGDP